MATQRYPRTAAKRRFDQVRRGKGSFPGFGKYFREIFKNGILCYPQACLVLSTDPRQRASQARGTPEKGGGTRGGRQQSYGSPPSAGRRAEADARGQGPQRRVGGPRAALESEQDQ